VEKTSPCSRRFIFSNNLKSQCHFLPVTSGVRQLAAAFVQASLLAAEL
jgi:hypothetical protein